MELYESRRLAIMDYNTNMRLFKEEGAKEKQIEIAKKLLAKKMSIDEIIDITGLDVSIIEKIKGTK